MKNLTVALVVVFLYLPAVAAGRTLFGGKIESGGYGGPLVKVGPIGGKTGIFVGGQGGWIMNHRFVLGGKGYVLVNDVDIEDRQNLKLEFACWGALVEYVFFPDNLLHFCLSSMIGAGSARYAVKNWQEPHDDVNYEEDAFFVVEPGVDAVLNIHKYFRIAAGASYRYTSGVGYEDLTNSDLSGVTGQVLLKFGVF